METHIDDWFVRGSELTMDRNTTRAVIYGLAMLFACVIVAVTGEGLLGFIALPMIIFFEAAMITG